MCRCDRHLTAAGKPKVVAATPIACEMTGFIWAIARSVMQPKPDLPRRRRRPTLRPFRCAGLGTQGGGESLCRLCADTIDACPLKQASPNTKPRPRGNQSVHERLSLNFPDPAVPKKLP